MTEALKRTAGLLMILAPFTLPAFVFGWAWLVVIAVAMTMAALMVVGANLLVGD